MGTVGILGMSTTVMGAEGVVVVVIIALLVSILVMSRRRKQPAQQTTPATPSVNYYTGLEQKQGGQPDPFASLTATPTVANPPAQPGSSNGANGQGPHGTTNGQGPGDGQTPAPVPVHTAAAAAGSTAPGAAPAPQPSPAPAPPAGTPAGWLPDPTGAPDTLRYWDGNAWTSHFAQRA